MGKLFRSDVIDENVGQFIAYFTDGTTAFFTLDRRLAQHLCLSGKLSFFKPVVEASFGKKVRTMFFTKETENGLQIHSLLLPLRQRERGTYVCKHFGGVTIWDCLRKLCEWLQANYSNELKDFFKIDGLKYKLDIHLLSKWYEEQISEEELLNKLLLE